LFPAKSTPGNCRTRKDGNVFKRESVLVVDSKPDTAEVLQAVFEPQGVEVCRVRRWCDTTATTLEVVPSVVVWDADGHHAETAPDENLWSQIPRIIIGKLHAPRVAEPANGNAPRTQFLNKPFKYADLMRAIESLMGAAAPQPLP
jgi:CheY-like chemotaxis protein